MRTLKLLRATIVVALICLIGGCAGFSGNLITHNLTKDGLYDNTNLLVDPLEDFSQAKKSYVYLLTKIKFAVDKQYAPFFKGATEYETEQISSGFVTTLPAEFPAGKYIMTDDHVVSLYAYTTEKRAMHPQYGPIKVTITLTKVLEKTTYLLFDDGQKIDLTAYEVFNDRPNDLALYRLPKGVDIPAYPYAFGNSDNLRVGNFVYMLGRPHNFTEANLREGRVSALSGPFYCRGLGDTGEASNYRPADHFMVSAGIDRGDSGLPVLGILDGRIEVIGLAHAKILGMEKLGIVQRIDHLVDVIRSYFEKTPKKFF